MHLAMHSIFIHTYINYLHGEIKFDSEVPEWQILHISLPLEELWPLDTGLILNRTSSGLTMGPGVILVRLCNKQHQKRISTYIYLYTYAHVCMCIYSYIVLKKKIFNQCVVPVC